jgi:hypothetical protein
MNTIDLIRLYERGSPAQKLWAIVLLLAVKDGATRVWYDPSRGDSRLGYEVGGVEYAMVPPPEILQALLPEVVGHLMYRRTVKGFIARLFAGAAGRLASVEGTFVVKVRRHRGVGGEGVARVKERMTMSRDPGRRQRARQLRRQLTPTEGILWREVRNRRFIRL